VEVNQRAVMGPCAGCNVRKEVDRQVGKTHTKKSVWMPSLTADFHTRFVL